MIPPLLYTSPMPKPESKRRPGRPRKPTTKTEAALHELESQIRPARRRISGKDREFIRQYIELGMSDPNAVAKSLGFKEPGIGWKLVERLRPLIDAERVRSSLGEQMELDEALKLVASGARDTGDRKTQAVFLQMILRVHGALSDKPLPPSDRRNLSRQVHEIIDRVTRAAQAHPGSKVRLKAMLGASIEAEAQAAPTEDSSGTNGAGSRSPVVDLPPPDDRDTEPDA